MFDDKPLIEHAANALRPFCTELVICGRQWPGLAPLADEPAPDLGPLGGIAAALLHASDKDFASVLTLGCDMPQIPAALLAAVAASCPSYCADAPVLGHWPAREGGALLAFLRDHGGEPKMLAIRRWANAIGAEAIRARGPLANINTPADLAAL